MQENKELYFGYFKHISQNIIFNDYVNLLPLNSYSLNRFCFNLFFPYYSIYKQSDCYKHFSQTRERANYFLF